MLALLRHPDGWPPGRRSRRCARHTSPPRALSTLGAISPEAQTQLLAPAILLPLVLAGEGASARAGRPPLRRGDPAVRGRQCDGDIAGLRPRRAVAGHRTPLVEPPVDLVVGERRARVHGLVARAVALLGRYSPPFLTWIENANAVVQTVGLLDVVRGTTHWLGHLLVPGGPWWPAGWAPDR